MPWLVDLKPKPSPKLAQAEFMPAEQDPPRRSRRVQLRCLDDALRESAYIYRAMVNGRISLEAGDTLSRVVGRHKEILAVRDQQQQLSALIEQLKGLQGGAALQWDLSEPETEPET